MKNFLKFFSKKLLIFMLRLQYNIVKVIELFQTILSYMMTMLRQYGHFFIINHFSLYVKSDSEEWFCLWYYRNAFSKLMNAFYIDNSNTKHGREVTHYKQDSNSKLNKYLSIRASKILWFLWFNSVISILWLFIFIYVIFFLPILFFLFIFIVKK